MTGRTLQKMFHTACRQLGLDSDARRGLQVVATGKAFVAVGNAMDDVVEGERGIRIGTAAGQPATRQCGASLEGQLVESTCLDQRMGEGGVGSDRGYETCVGRVGHLSLSAVVRAAQDRDTPDETKADSLLRYDQENQTVSH